MIRTLFKNNFLFFSLFFYKVFQLENFKLKIFLKTKLLLASKLDGGQWSVSGLCRFTLGEITPLSHWREGWVDPITGLDYMVKLKYLNPPELELRTLSHRDCASAVPIPVT
jgi:hypothetical protein